MIHLIAGLPAHRGDIHHFGPIFPPADPEGFGGDGVELEGGALVEEDDVGFVDAVEVVVGLPAEPCTC